MIHRVQNPPPDRSMRIPSSKGRSAGLARVSRNRPPAPAIFGPLIVPILFPAALSAATHEFDLSGHATPITDEAGLSRILLDLSFLDTLACETVLDGRLFIPRQTVTEEHALEIHPITSAWSIGSVGWNSPWDSAGGDYSRGTLERIRIKPAGQTDDDWEISVTRLVSVQLADTSNANGLILMPPEQEAAGFATSWERVFTAAGGLMLRLICH